MENLFGEQKDSLDLVVTKFSLGELASNAQEVLVLIREKIKTYSIENYSEDTIDLAKRDKADLNNFAKKLNDVKITYKKRWLKPFEDAFEEPITEAINEIKSGSAAIDALVKAVEDKAKAEKKAQIEAFFKMQGCEYFTLEQIFNPQWLNKTYKMKDIEQEILAKIDQVKNDLAVIDRIGEPDGKAYYLKTLDMQATLAEIDAIKANRERLAEIEGKKQEAKPIQEAPIEAIPVMEAKQVNPDIYERVFRVRGTKEQIIALGDFMNANGIEFERIQ